MHCTLIIKINLNSHMNLFVEWKTLPVSYKQSVPKRCLPNCIWVAISITKLISKNFCFLERPIMQVSIWPVTPPPPGTPGLLHRNVCPAPGLLHNRKCPGVGPINDDVPGAGHLYQLAFKHESYHSYLGLKIKMYECPIGPGKVQKTHNAISNCLFALGP